MKNGSKWDRNMVHLNKFVVFGVSLHELLFSLMSHNGIILNPSIHSEIECMFLSLSWIVMNGIEITNLPRGNLINSAAYITLS